MESQNSYGWQYRAALRHCVSKIEVTVVESHGNSEDRTFYHSGNSYGEIVRQTLFYPKLRLDQQINSHVIIEERGEEARPNHRKPNLVSISLYFIRFSSMLMPAHHTFIPNSRKYYLRISVDFFGLSRNLNL